MLDVKALHKLSFRQRAALQASTQCGCFSCLRIFAPGEITEWVHRDQDETAICPYCETDSVLPGSEVEIPDGMLKVMQHEWFPAETFGAL